MLDKKLQLKQLRVLSNLSRDELAKKTGLTSRTIYSYEKDINNLRKANYETLEKLASALGVSVDNIFLSIDSEKPKLKDCI